MTNRADTLLNETIRAGLKQALKDSWSYSQYREEMARQVEAGETSGIQQSPDRIQYTLLNHRRMKRWEKTFRFPETVASKIKDLLAATSAPKRTWLVLTETWCGDAAPMLPLADAFARAIPGIDLRIASRDDHPELMEQFRTDGALSIPKLLILDQNQEKVLAEWGPRPVPARKLVQDYKAAHGKLTAEFREELQQWYNKDRGQHIAEELAYLL
ncbi:Thioredoxin [Robiginitalea myxolifaciens]|uniref:Thioredoxin n=1 Tax=Robiginitalea myxolifaciens TaxID=400055 RepID=A0A1I6G8F0_9FLAO|nr:thioredoxin family protein [Robiginitalea myxolifaciens]SFR38476.1 Thioredoxin [Robiginitalea myxolifaciens]